MKDILSWFGLWFTLTLFGASMGHAQQDLHLAPQPDWSLVEKRLLKAGLKPNFIAGLKESYRSDDFLEILELNTLLFLKKADYHGIQVTSTAIDEVHAFIESNQACLKQAEETYKVPGEVVASLLWLESRYGKNEGHFHVPSVFADLMQADRPSVLRHLNHAAHKYTRRVGKRVKAQIRIRARRRVAWALKELRAIQQMQQKNSTVLNKFPGSFAGAFGMAQYEPTSYLSYARARDPGHPPDLEKIDDAVFSVAYYLHANGWRQNRRKSRVRSLMKYNNSHDYARAILKLARSAATKP